MKISFAFLCLSILNSDSVLSQSTLTARPATSIAPSASPVPSSTTPPSSTSTSSAGTRPSVNPSPSTSVIPSNATDTSSLSCQDAVNGLVGQASPCLNAFYSSVGSGVVLPKDADTAAQAFINCICSTSWVAGSQFILSASVPDCPAPGGLSKGGMAAVANQCSPSSQGLSRRQVIQSFRLNVTTSRGIYVPLSGYAPGSVPPASAAAQDMALFFGSMWWSLTALGFSSIVFMFL